MSRKPITKQEVKNMQKMRRGGMSAYAISRKCRRDRGVVASILAGKHPLAPKPTVPVQIKFTKEQYTLTLCWYCKNACGGCSWSRSLVPVEGWDAKETANRTDRSFFVRKCPQFSPEANYREG